MLFKRTKHIFLAIAILGILMFSCTAFAAEAYKNEPEGFRGLKWGSDFSAVKNEMVYSRTDDSYGGIDFYTRKNEELVVGSTAILEIEYGFWRGQLSCVTIYTNKKNWNSVTEELIAEFGIPYKSPQKDNSYWWFGDITCIHSYLDTNLDMGIIDFDSEVMTNQMAPKKDTKKSPKF